MRETMRRHVLLRAGERKGGRKEVREKMGRWWRHGQEEERVLVEKGREEGHGQLEQNEGTS